MAKTKKHIKEHLEIEKNVEQVDLPETVVLIGTGTGGLLEGKEYIYPISNALILVNKGIAVYK